MTDTGNAAQVRIIADQVGEAAAEAAIKRFAQTYVQATPKAEMPAPIKWAAGIIGVVMSTGIAALCFWVVSSLSDLQLTVARIDERQQQDTTIQRLDKIEERIARLEQRKGEE